MVHVCAHVDKQINTDLSKGMVIFYYSPPKPFFPINYIYVCNFMQFPIGQTTVL